jgi:hypothetical protein
MDSTSTLSNSELTQKDVFCFSNTLSMQEESLEIHTDFRTTSEWSLGVQHQLRKVWHALRGLGLDCAYLIGLKGPRTNSEWTPTSVNRAEKDSHRKRRLTERSD